jgi:hypothetical protein
VDSHGGGPSVGASALHRPTSAFWWFKFP